jgi:hypothetical protein
VVEDADTDVLQRLGNLVGGVDVLLGGITLLSGVTFGTARAIAQEMSHTRTLSAAQNQLLLSLT